MSQEQRGRLPHIFDELKVNIAESSVLGASGRTIEIAVAKNVQATLDFTYYPAGSTDEDGAPEVRFHKIGAVNGVMFDGLNMVLSVNSGYDLMEFLNESEIEALADSVIKRAGKS